MKKLSVLVIAVALLVHNRQRLEEKFDDLLAGGSEEKTCSITGLVLEMNLANNTITMRNDPVPGLIQRSPVLTVELRGQRVDSLDLSGNRAWVSATLHLQGRKHWVTNVASIGR